MLVIRNSTGVPSVAAWLRLDSNANLAPATVTGRVTNATGGAGISGATVSWAGGSTTTSATGNYTLANVAPGEHSITSSKTGFATVARSIICGAGSQVTVDFTLAAPGGIDGHVTDAGTSLSLAGATITYPGGTVTTGSTGSYIAYGIAPGMQSVIVSATGYQSVTQSVLVVANTITTTDFALTQLPPHIEGEVQDAITQTPIVGATVSYHGGQAQTNAAGFYRLDDVPAGNWDVTCPAPGYLPMTDAVVVTTGSYSVAGFDLTPAPAQAFTLVPTAD